MHNFQQAKAAQAAIESEVSRYSALLGAFPKNGPLGLTPDAVKASPEYRDAKAGFDRAFGRLRSFNAFYVKAFAGELRAERRARRAPKT